jgi:hypothetical protein
MRTVGLKTLIIITSCLFYVVLCNAGLSPQIPASESVQAFEPIPAVEPIPAYEKVPEDEQNFWWILAPLGFCLISTICLMAYLLHYNLLCGCNKENETNQETEGEHLAHFQNQVDAIKILMTRSGVRRLRFQNVVDMMPIIMEAEDEHSAHSPNAVDSVKIDVITTVEDNHAAHSPNAVDSV